MKIINNVDLSKFTSFKIGGCTKYYAEARNKDDIDEIFEFAYKNNINSFIIGGGTNLLVSDDGFDGIVIKLVCDEIEINHNTNEVSVQSGCKLNKLITLCIDNNLSGIENLIGIPGTVGGAVRGNAGAYQTEIKDVIKTVTYYKNGELYTIPAEDCNFKYRDSQFKKESNILIMSVELKLEKSDKNNDIREKSKEILRIRKEKQPLEFPNAGSFFKNPILDINYFNKISIHNSILEQSPIWETDDGKIKLPAAYLIEKTGLKGYRINDVGVSKKHSLFIVNYGNGKAKDVIDLMEHIQYKVNYKFGIFLEQEIEFLGF